MTKENFGFNEKTFYIDNKPVLTFIPLMNPKYLLEEDLWDTNEDYEYFDFPKNLFE